MYFSDVLLRSVARLFQLGDSTVVWKFHLSAWTDLQILLHIFQSFFQSGLLPFAYYQPKKKPFHSEKRTRRNFCQEIFQFFLLTFFHSISTIFYNFLLFFDGHWLDSAFQTFLFTVTVPPSPWRFSGFFHHIYSFLLCSSCLDELYSNRSYILSGIHFFLECYTHERWKKVQRRPTESRVGVQVALFVYI